VRRTARGEVEEGGAGSGTEGRVQERTHDEGGETT
jgi:hypothetical protein